MNDLRVQDDDARQAATKRLLGMLGRLRSPQQKVVSAGGQGTETPPSPISAIEKPLAADPYLVSIIAVLVALGILMVFSASFTTQGTTFFVRQLVWAALGVAVLSMMYIFPISFWRKMALPLMVSAVLLLIAVLLSERVANGGTYRHLIGSSFQPSAIVWLIMTIYLSAWADTRSDRLRDLRQGFLPFALLVCIIAGVVALDRGFSTAILIILVSTILFLVAGGRLKHVAIAAAISFPILLFFMVQAQYPMARLSQWWAIQTNSASISPDTLRILGLLRSGQGIGVDPSFWQNKAGVPLLWSDYLFVNIRADLGYLGMIGTAALFVLFGYIGLRVAGNASDRFSALVAVGITTWIFTQAAMHIGSTLFLLPSFGVPLPFMSYGGSSLLGMMAGAGLLLNISRISKRPISTTSRGTANRGDPLTVSSRSSESAPKNQPEKVRSRATGDTQPVGTDVSRVSPLDSSGSKSLTRSVRDGTAKAGPEVWDAAVSVPEVDHYVRRWEDITNGTTSYPSPFSDVGRITDPARFFDREDLLRRVFDELGKHANLCLVGESQVGRSSVLSMICALGQQRMGLRSDAFAYLSIEWVDGEDDFYTAFSHVLGLNETLRGYNLRRALSGRRVVVCIDDVDMMEAQGIGIRVRSQLRGLADGADAPLKLVIASRLPLDRLFPDLPELDSPLAGICRHLTLEPFSPEVSRVFLAHRLDGTGVTFDESQIVALWTESMGYPGRLRHAADRLYHNLIGKRAAEDRDVWGRKTREFNMKHDCPIASLH